MLLGIALAAIALACAACAWALRAQRALARARRDGAHLQDILDNIPVGVTLVDSESRVVAYNPAACDLLELPAAMFADGPPTLEALVRFNAARGEYGPGDVDTLVEIILSRARLPRGRRVERTRPNGKVLEIHGETLPDGSFVTVYTDITERRAAEQALKREAFDLQSILDHLPQGISVFDDALRLQRWNAGLLEVLDLPPSAVYAGVPFEHLLMFPARRGEYGPGDPAEQVAARRALALKFEPHRFERTRPNGRTHLVEGKPMSFDGKVVGFITSYTDITDRREAEHALQTKHALLETLLENIPSGVTVFDADLQLALYNQESLRLTGVPESLVAQRPHFSDVIRYNAMRGEYGEVDVDAHVARMLELARHPTEHNIERVRPDGQVLEIRGAPLPGGGFVTIYNDITGRRTMERALTRRSAYLQAILEQLPQGISVFDESLRLKHWNNSFADVLDLPGAAVHENADFEALVRIPALRGEYGAGDVDELVRARCALAARFEPHRFTRTRPNGRTHLVEGKPMAIDGALVGFITTYTDITDQIVVEEELRARNETFSTLIENMPGGVSLFDGQFRLVTANSAFRRLLGFPDALFEGGTTLERIFRFNAERGEYGDCDPEAKVRELIARAELREAHVFERTRPDGTVLEIRGLPLADGGFVTIYTDITEHKRTAAAIERLAHRDPLTGLDNRYTLEARLAQSIADARRHRTRLALMFIDMDNFKAINDSLGHAVGDEYLIEIARRLRSELREADIVARPGGDEFVVVLTDAHSVDAVATVAAGLLDALAGQMQLAQQRISPSASVGIAMFPQDGEDRGVLMKNADIAMYAAKGAGRGGYRFFDVSMTEAADLRLRMEAELRDAIAAESLELHYQPQVNAVTGRIVGVEALIRWRKSPTELVPPGQFIPLAEETGLIGAIGEWALREACATLQRWRGAGLGDLHMAVNLSARQLHNAQFPAVVERALAATGVPPHLLELEVTESVAMEDPQVTINTLRALKRLGVLLSIDDFGTGYSSLAYLKLLPIDRLKLDRTFVTDIEVDPNDAVICAATIGLAHNLGLTVVAEGVETRAQADYLKGLDCDLMQGYLFARPQPEADVRACIEAGYDDDAVFPVRPSGVAARRTTETGNSSSSGTERPVS